MTRAQPTACPHRATVQVWVAPLDPPPAVYGQLVASLSNPERARTGRYRFARHARRFAAGRGWLRHVLAAELGAAPADIPLVEDGKPRLAGMRGLHFNISRAHELAVIAVSPRPVGVDLERVGSLEHGDGLVAVFCTTKEADALRGLPADERPRAFLRLWTAKEAYVKATGTGLSVAPSSLEIGTSLVHDGAPVRTADDDGRWWVRELHPADGHISAVAAEGRDWEICLRSTSELALGLPGPSRQ